MMAGGSHRPRQGATSTMALVLVAVLCGAAACAPWEVGAEQDVVKNGIRFDKFRLNSDGSMIGDLAEDTEIDGWPCRQGFVGFHADWRLDECRLAEAHVRNGVAMPAGTRVFPDQRGNPGVCLFPHDVEIQGFSCRGNRKGGFMTAFYPNGRLHWFYTREPVTLDGVTCADTLFQAVYLHPNGRLQRCKLEEAATIAGQPYRKGVVIEFDPAGAVIGQ